MLSEKMIGCISEQIKKEYESAYLYLEIADFYDSKGLKGFANWYKIQAREEEDHAMLFYDYLHVNNAQIKFYSIDPQIREFKNLNDPIIESMKHEQYITNSINKLYELAELEKDYRTQNFLSWFISEQMEEEENALNLLNQMKLFGESTKSLYELNKEFDEREYAGCEKCN